MKMVKGLLLGSAAGLVAVTGAQAADLPLAEPVEYVKVCSTYGNGYFYIPGTQTCLRISGFARFDMRISDDGIETPVVAGTPPAIVGFLENDRFDMAAIGRVTFDARSETEWGTLRGVVQFQNGASGTPGANVRNAFIQFAGVTAGRVQSFFDYVPYNHFGDLLSDDQVDTLAYTFGFGSGFSATIGLEDPADRRLGGFLTATAPTLASPFGTFAFSDGGSRHYPNVVAALRVDQAWGSAQLSGAIQENRIDSLFTPALGTTIFADDSEWGWAVQAGASVNLPWAEGSLLWLTGAYTEGALGYLGADSLLGNLPNFTGASSGLGSLLASDFGVNADGTIENVEAWLIGGGFGYAFSPAISFNVGATYLDADSAGTGAVGFLGGTPSYDVTTVLANVIWAPVQNLNIGVEGIYQRIDIEDFDSEDSWGVRTRIQRNF